MKMHWKYRNIKGNVSFALNAGRKQNTAFKDNGEMQNANISLRIPKPNFFTSQDFYEI